MVGDEIRFLAYQGSTVTLDGTGISILQEEGLVDLSDKSFISVSGLRVVNSMGKYTEIEFITYRG